MYIKNDANKLRYDLIPPEGLEELARTYTHGASHPDGARRWEQGGSWLRLFAAMMRHAWKWRRGEDYDKESGLHHMASVAFYAMALVTYKVRGVKEDDRVITETDSNQEVYRKWLQRIYSPSDNKGMPRVPFINGAF